MSHDNSIPRHGRPIELAAAHCMEENVQLKMDLHACGQTIAEQAQRIAELVAAFEAAKKTHDESMTALAERVSAARSDATRARAQMYALAQHMPPFLSYYLETFAAFKVETLTEEVQQMIRDALDYIQLLVAIKP